MDTCSSSNDLLHGSSKPATDFTSREGIMTDLDAKLCLPNKHSRVALVGLGGGIG